jgi:hypothetical protein
MKNSILIFFLLLFIFFAQILNAQEVGVNSNKRLELKNSVLNSSSQTSKFEITKNIQDIEADSKEKSPVLGAIMSGIIPGAGEIYAESYIKGAIFAAAEVGLWLLKINFDKKGDDQTTLFQNYADANWDIYKYAAWLKAENFPGAQSINENEPNREILRQQVNAVESVNFSHTLPEFGAQQYYEVIGKYNSFFAGWSFIPSNTITRNNWFDYESADVDNYMSERQKANNYYDNASLAVTGVILNHLLSAADAAWSVSMFNNDIKIKTGMEFKSLYSNSHNRRMLIPFGNVSITF